MHPCSSTAEGSLTKASQHGAEPQRCLAEGMCHPGAAAALGLSPVQLGRAHGGNLSRELPPSKAGVSGSVSAEPCWGGREPSLTSSLFASLLQLASEDPAPIRSERLRAGGPGERGWGGWVCTELCAASACSGVTDGDGTAAAHPQTPEPGPSGTGREAAAKAQGRESQECREMRNSQLLQVLALCSAPQHIWEFAIRKALVPHAQSPAKGAPRARHRG